VVGQRQEREAIKRQEGTKRRWRGRNEEQKLTEGNRRQV